MVENAMGRRKKGAAEQSVWCIPRLGGAFGIYVFVNQGIFASTPLTGEFVVAETYYNNGRGVAT